MIIETIKISSQHFNNVGTTTLGEIMYAGDLPVTYLIIWFAVKLPLLVLIGLIIIPFVEKKIFNDKKSHYFWIFISIIINYNFYLNFKASTFA